MLNLARTIVSRSSSIPYSHIQRRIMSTQVPERMKCILVKDGKGPAENLYLGEEPVPKAKEGEVLVKVSFCSTGHACSTMADRSHWPISNPPDQGVRTEPDGSPSARRKVPSSSCCEQDHYGSRIRRRNCQARSGREERERGQVEDRGQGLGSSLWRMSGYVICARSSLPFPLTFYHG